MKLYEIKNDEWEENIKYYYSSKKEYNREQFLSIVRYKEKDIPSFIDFEISITYKNLYLDDFLLKELKLNLENDIIYLIEDEWYFKAIFIETREYYALRIWETFA